MNILLDEVIELIESLSSSCGEWLLSSYDCVTMHPWISVAAGILGYVVAMRTMCR